MTVVPAVMLGLICSDSGAMGAHAMGWSGRLRTGAMVGVVVLTGLLTIPTLIG